MYKDQRYQKIKCLEKREIAAFCALIISIFLYVCVVKSGYTLHRNIGKSLPHILSYGKPFKEIKRGMYVSFSHPRSQSKVTKRIQGLPGDKVIIHGNNLWVNNEIVGVLKQTTPSGQFLHPISHQSIPEGFLFVSGLHPDSFDSRYQEFGLIPIESVEEEICPLF